MFKDREACSSTQRGDQQTEWDAICSLNSFYQYSLRGNNVCGRHCYVHRDSAENKTGKVLGHEASVLVWEGMDVMCQVTTSLCYGENKTEEGISSVGLGEGVLF